MSSSIDRRASAGGAPAPRRPAARTPSIDRRASAGGAPAPRRPAARTPSIDRRASAGGAPAPRRPAASIPRYWALTVRVPGDLSEWLTHLAWELGALGVVAGERPGSRRPSRPFVP